MGRDAIECRGRDRMLLGYLRRMNLDVMWSREKTTVNNALLQLRKGARMSEELGLPVVDIVRGPWPIGDDIGVQIALEMLRASQLEGKNDQSYQQFETIRKLRSAFSNAFETGPPGVTKGNLVFRPEKGKSWGLRNAPTESLFFCQFVEGLLSRMGRVTLPDVALSNEQVHVILDLALGIIRDPKADHATKRMAIMSGAYFALLYGCSLRGNEGLYLEGSSLVDMIKVGKDGRTGQGAKDVVQGHVCAPLLGRFKNEVGEQRQVMVMVNRSKSGLRFRVWMELLAMVLKREGKEKVAGPAFCKENGDMISQAEFNQELNKYCELAQKKDKELFLSLVGPTGKRSYSVSRSLRRGSNSRATEEGVSKDVRELINRWRTFENKRGQRPNMSMTQHYLEIRLVLKSLLVYSNSL